MPRACHITSAGTCARRFAEVTSWAVSGAPAALASIALTRPPSKNGAMRSIATSDIDSEFRNNDRVFDFESFFVNFVAIGFMSLAPFKLSLELPYRLMS